MMEANYDSLQLPEGWVWIKVGDISEKLQYGSSKKADGDPSGIPVIRMGNIQGGEIIYDNLKYFPSTSKELDDLLLEDGDVLFNRTNSPELVGKTAVYKNNHPRAVFASYLIRIKVKKLFYDPRLLSLFINSIYGRKFIKSVVSQQVGQANVNGAKLSSMPIPLAPLPEQHRIVTKIEELFSRLDAGVEALHKAQAQLKRYRQAVLKAAVEGRLTEEWRKEHPEGEPTEGLFEQINRIKLPHGWVSVILKNICAHITDGDHQAPPQSSSGIPFLVISNIREGELDFTKTRFVPMDYYRSIPLKRKPSPGDILYSLVGSYGIPVIVNTEREFCFQRHIGLIRPSKHINTEYLVYYLKSHLAFEQATEAATGTAQLTVPLQGLRNFKVPFPPLIEQEAIVSEIERILSASDLVESTLKINLKKADHLRQSILKRAFEGKLVPQDPGDEPASVLLERIKAERAKENTQPKRARKGRSPARSGTRTLEEFASS